MKALPVISIIAFSPLALAADAGTSPECTTVFTAFPDDVPSSPEDALKMAQKGVEYAKAKNWWGLSAIVIFVAMFVMKTVGLFRKIGKRWAYITVASLSMAAMVLAKFAGGLSWGAAMAVLTSGPFMSALSDLVKRGVMGKEPATPMKGKKKNG